MKLHYAVLQGGHAPILQVVATMLKVPVLFFLTLAVTFPSLYVFNALVGSRLSVLSVLRLLVISLIVMLTVLASLGPIVAFFAASTTSYPFMLILNVLIFTVSGFLGLRYMLITLHRLSLVLAESLLPPPASGTAPFAPSLPTTGTAASPAAPSSISAPAMDMPAPSPASEINAYPAPPTSFAPGVGVSSPAASPAGPPVLPTLGSRMPAPRAGALDGMTGRLITKDVQTVFRVWIVVFGLVGAQMAWVLRPFLGSPQHAFAWFRPRESNFFEALLYALQHLFR